MQEIILEVTRLDGTTTKVDVYQAVEAAVGHLLANNQYRFRKGKSTLDAIKKIIGKGEKAISGVRWE